MNTCYKCGRPTPNTDPECDDCAHGHGPVPDHVRAGIEAMKADLQARAVPVDLSKVKTVADLVLVFSVFSPQLVVLRGTPEYEKLKHLLAE